MFILIAISLGFSSIWAIVAARLRTSGGRSTLLSFRAIISLTSSMRVPYSNCTRITELPSVEVEVICFSPLISAIACSRGMVTLFTTSSACACGYTVSTVVRGSSISGISSIFRVRVAHTDTAANIMVISMVSHFFFNAILVTQFTKILLS